jgi:uncharacterized lipoprotein YbaY
MKRLAIAAVCLLLLAGSGGCARSSGKTVRGEVVTGMSGSYPVGATLLVRIADVSGPKAILLAENSETMVPGWEAPGTHPPKPFAVAYHGQAIDPDHTYLIWAEVRDEGGMTAASVAVPTITRGAATAGIELPLAQGSDAATPPIP